MRRSNKHSTKKISGKRISSVNGIEYLYLNNFHASNPDRWVKQFSVQNKDEIEDFEKALVVERQKNFPCDFPDQSNIGICFFLEDARNFYNGRSCFENEPFYSKIINFKKTLSNEYSQHSNDPWKPIQVLEKIVDCSGAIYYNLMGKNGVDKWLRLNELDNASELLENYEHQLDSRNSNFPWLSLIANNQPLIQNPSKDLSNIKHDPSKPKPFVNPERLQNFKSSKDSVVGADLSKPKPFVNPERLQNFKSPKEHIVGLDLSKPKHFVNLERLQNFRSSKDSIKQTNPSLPKEKDPPQSSILKQQEQKETEYIPPVFDTSEATEISGIHRKKKSKSKDIDNESLASITESEKTVSFSLDKTSSPKKLESTESINPIIMPLENSLPISDPNEKPTSESILNIEDIPIAEIEIQNHIEEYDEDIDESAEEVEIDEVLNIGVVNRSKVDEIKRPDINQLLSSTGPNIRNKSKVPDILDTHIEDSSNLDLSSLSNIRDKISEFINERETSIEEQKGDISTLSREINEPDWSKIEIPISDSGFNRKLIQERMAPRGIKKMSTMAYINSTAKPLKASKPSTEIPDPVILRGAIPNYQSQDTPEIKKIIQKFNLIPTKNGTQNLGINGLSKKFNSIGRPASVMNNGRQSYLGNKLENTKKQKDKIHKRGFNEISKKNRTNSIERKNMIPNSLKTPKSVSNTFKSKTPENTNSTKTKTPKIYSQKKSLAFSESSKAPKNLEKRTLGSSIKIPNDNSEYISIQDLAKISESHVSNKKVKKGDMHSTGEKKKTSHSESENKNSSSQTKGEPVVFVGNNEEAKKLKLSFYSNTYLFKPFPKNLPSKSANHKSNGNNKSSAYSLESSANKKESSNLKTSRIQISESEETSSDSEKDETILTGLSKNIIKPTVNAFKNAQSILRPLKTKHIENKTSIILSDDDKEKLKGKPLNSLLTRDMGDDNKSRFLKKKKSFIVSDDDFITNSETSLVKSRFVDNIDDKTLNHRKADKNSTRKSSRNSGKKIRNYYEDLSNLNIFQTHEKEKNESDSSVYISQASSDHESEIEDVSVDSSESGIFKTRELRSSRNKKLNRVSNNNIDNMDVDDELIGSTTFDLNIFEDLSVPNSKDNDICEFCNLSGLKAHKNAKWISSNIRKCKNCPLVTHSNCLEHFLERYKISTLESSLPLEKNIWLPKIRDMETNINWICIFCQTFKYEVDKILAYRQLEVIDDDNSPENHSVDVLDESDRISDINPKFQDSGLNNIIAESNNEMKLATKERISEKNLDASIDSAVEMSESIYLSKSSTSTDKNSAKNTNGINSVNQKNLNTNSGVSGTISPIEIIDLEDQSKFKNPKNDVINEKPKDAVDWPKQEFLVKLKDFSYRNLCWIPSFYVKLLNTSKYRNAIKNIKPDTPESRKFIIPLSYIQAEYFLTTVSCDGNDILARNQALRGVSDKSASANQLISDYERLYISTKSVYVKWKGLPVSESTYDEPPHPYAESQEYKIWLRVWDNFLQMRKVSSLLSRKHFLSFQKKQFAKSIQLREKEMTSYAQKKQAAGRNIGFGDYSSNSELKKVRAKLREHHSEELSRIKQIEMEERKTWLKNAFSEFKIQPDYLKGGTLYPYQLEGINWLLYKWMAQESCILADEMGLGKTIQIVAFFSILMRMMLPNSSKNNIKPILSQNRLVFPFLVVVPNSVIDNWIYEINRWTPDTVVVALTGSKESKKLISDYLLFRKTASESDNAKDLQCHVVVTSYETVTRGDGLRILKSYKGEWMCMVVDEGHRLKNDRSKLFTQLCTLECRHRVLLTGTPVQNNVREVINLMNFVRPEEFPSTIQLEKEYENANEEKLGELRNKMKPHLLRRLRDEALGPLLPAKHEIIVPVTLGLLQRELYRAALKKNIKALEYIQKLFKNAENDGSAKNHRTLSMRNVLMQLRKIIDHPYLIEQTTPEFNSIKETHDHLKQSSGKFQALDLIVKELVKRKRRVLIFVQFKDILNILEDYFYQEQLAFLRLDGDTPQADRQIIVDEFNKNTEKYFAFIATTRAGGVGLNLYSADTVILYSPDWNPHMDMQALSRAYRIGQNKPVLVFKLMTVKSAEERIVQVGAKKMLIDHILIEKMNSEDNSELVSDIDLASAIKCGAEQLFQEHESNYSSIIYDEAKIKLLLDECEQKLKEEDEAKRNPSDSDTAKSKAAEKNIFSFARVWDVNQNTEQVVDTTTTDKNSNLEWIQKIREEIDSQNLSNEQLGRGFRKRNHVDYYNGFDSVFKFPAKPPRKLQTENSQNLSDASDPPYLDNPNSEESDLELPFEEFLELENELQAKSTVKNKKTITGGVINFSINPSISNAPTSGVQATLASFSSDNTTFINYAAEMNKISNITLKRSDNSQNQTQVTPVNMEGPSSSLANGIPNVVPPNSQDFFSSNIKKMVSSDPVGTGRQLIMKAIQFGASANLNQLLQTSINLGYTADLHFVVSSIIKTCGDQNEDVESICKKLCYYLILCCQETIKAGPRKSDSQFLARALKFVSLPINMGLYNEILKVIGVNNNNDQASSIGTGSTLDNIPSTSYKKSVPIAPAKVKLPPYNQETLRVVNGVKPTPTASLPIKFTEPNTADTSKKSIDISTNNIQSVGPTLPKSTNTIGESDVNIVQSSTSKIPSSASSTQRTTDKITNPSLDAHSSLKRKVQEALTQYSALSKAAINISSQGTPIDSTLLHPSKKSKALVDNIASSKANELVTNSNVKSSTTIVSNSMFTTNHQKEAIPKAIHINKHGFQVENIEKSVSSAESPVVAHPSSLPQSSPNLAVSLPTTTIASDSTNDVSNSSKAPVPLTEQSKKDSFKLSTLPSVASSSDIVSSHHPNVSSNTVRTEPQIPANTKTANKVNDINLVNPQKTVVLGSDSTQVRPNQSLQTPSQVDGDNFLEIAKLQYTLALKDIKEKFPLILSSSNENTNTSIKSNLNELVTKVVSVSKSRTETERTDAIILCFKIFIGACINIVNSDVVKLMQPVNVFDEALNSRVFTLEFRRTLFNNDSKCLLHPDTNHNNKHCIEDESVYNLLKRWYLYQLINFKLSSPHLDIVPSYEQQKTKLSNNSPNPSSAHTSDSSVRPVSRSPQASNQNKSLANHNVSSANPETMSQSTASGAKAPSQTIPQTSVPSQTTPQTSVPSQNIPQVRVPSQIIPQTSVPSQTIPQVRVPSQTFPAITRTFNYSTNDTISLNTGGSAINILPISVSNSNPALGTRELSPNLPSSAHNKASSENIPSSGAWKPNASNIPKLSNTYDNRIMQQRQTPEQAGNTNPSGSTNYQSTSGSARASISSTGSDDIPKNNSTGSGPNENNRLPENYTVAKRNYSLSDFFSSKEIENHRNKILARQDMNQLIQSSKNDIIANRIINQKNLNSASNISTVAQTQETLNSQTKAQLQKRYEAELLAQFQQRINEQVKMNIESYQNQIHARLQAGIQQEVEKHIKTYLNTAGNLGATSSSPAQVHEAEFRESSLTNYPQTVNQNQNSGKNYASNQGQSGSNYYAGNNMNSLRNTSLQSGSRGQVVNQDNAAAASVIDLISSCPLCGLNNPLHVATDCSYRFNLGALLTRRAFVVNNPSYPPNLKEMIVTVIDKHIQRF
ncbi:hypothetical protein BB558_004036 [Smittium angustum]|uniref:Uncharacterized protein n=1 Tax=Smittium angustum TaxID=133377 RepID=A0A2U1J4N2_SMIAN|nr:hypothetical protein BB558_004036 [Smittium angustum]